MPKRPSKLKDIVARSITLTDSQGKTRIYLGVMGEPGEPPHSSICLFGDRERSIEISADPEGGLSDKDLSALCHSVSRYTSRVTHFSSAAGVV